LFRTREQRIKSGDEVIYLVSQARLDGLLRAVITVIAAVLLLVPVFILFKLQPTDRSEVERKGIWQILTIFFFTLLFSASCSIFTQARRQEVFTATAAYSAVFVVFLGNTSNVMATSASGS
jgi:ABC-type transport system involved in multi-copper enzyme maturation permease subunit